MTSSLLRILAARAHANTAEGRPSPLIRRDLSGTAALCAAGQLSESDGVDGVGLQRAPGSTGARPQVSAQARRNALKAVSA